MTSNGVCKQIPVKKTFPDIILFPAFRFQTRFLLRYLSPPGPIFFHPTGYKIQAWLELKFRQAQAGSAREMTRLETSLRASQLVANTSLLAFQSPRAGPVRTLI